LTYKELNEEAKQINKSGRIVYQEEEEEGGSGGQRPQRAPQRSLERSRGL